MLEPSPLVWMHTHVRRPPYFANETLGPPESGPVSEFTSGPELTPGWGPCAPSSLHTAHTKVPDCGAQQEADLGEGAQSSLSLPLRELLPSRSVTQTPEQRRRSEHGCGLGSGSPLPQQTSDLASPTLSPAAKCRSGTCLRLFLAAPHVERPVSQPLSWAPGQSSDKTDREPCPGGACVPGGDGPPADVCVCTHVHTHV